MKFKPHQTMFVSSLAERVARERQRPLPSLREPAQIIVAFTKINKKVSLSSLLCYSQNI
jgi:hypothetical protein